MSRPPATYMYCLVRLDTPPSTELPDGLPHTGPVRLLDIGGGLCLVAADAAREHYGEEAIGVGLRDLDWVAERAIAHESVVEHFLLHGDVLPFKLFTLFDSDRRALEDLAARRSHIETELARLRGCREWEIRVADAAGRHAQPGEAVTQDDTPQTGTEFLERQRDRLLGRRQRLAQTRAAAEAALAELAGIARGCCPKDRPAPASDELPVECAFLLGAAELAGFRSRVAEISARLARQELEVSMSGPWPPYHFVTRSP